MLHGILPPRCSEKPARSRPRVGWSPDQSSAVSEQNEVWGAVRFKKRRKRDASTTFWLPHRPSVHKNWFTDLPEDSPVAKLITFNRKRQNSYQVFRVFAKEWSCEAALDDYFRLRWNGHKTWTSVKETTAGLKTGFQTWKNHTANWNVVSTERRVGFTSSNNSSAAIRNLDMDASTEQGLSFRKKPPVRSCPLLVDFWQWIEHYVTIFRSSTFRMGLKEQSTQSKKIGSKKDRLNESDHWRKVNDACLLFDPRTSTSGGSKHKSSQPVHFQFSVLVYE